MNSDFNERLRPFNAAKVRDLIVGGYAVIAREGLVDQMGRPPARVDLLMSIQGVRFSDAWRNRMGSDFDGIPTQVISRSDLIASKRAAARPQDLIDVANLLESERLAGGPTEEPRRPKRPRPKRRDPGPER